MRLLRTFIALLALATAGSSFADLAADKKKAQADGLAIGNAAQKTGVLSPASLSAAGTAKDGTTVWGDSYTGTANKAQTDKVGASSMIGVGNQAINESEASFRGYNTNRDDQGSQATYFLRNNPILKPEISQSDPLFVIPTSNFGKNEFASGSSTQCGTKEVKHENPKEESHTCQETYKPYVVPCSNDSIIEFESVAAPNIPANIDSYSCPSNATLSGQTCTSTTSSTNSATTVYSCPAGYVKSGTNCVLTTAATADASISYSCPRGTLSGSVCHITEPGTYDAAVKYSCPSGQVLSGTSCLISSSAVTDANVSYSCPKGTLRGTVCEITEPGTSDATVQYSCPSGQVLSGTSCLISSSTITDANKTYSCPSGGTLNGTQCEMGKDTPATSTLSCPNGGALQGSSCVSTGTTGATATNTCKAGLHLELRLEGLVCSGISTTSPTIDPNETSCPDLGSDAGMVDWQKPSECVYWGVAQKPVSYYSGLAGKVGTSVVNLVCEGGMGCFLRTTSLPKKVCPAGATLNASGQCETKTTATPDTSYSCPSGGTLNGSSCSTVSSTPATSTLSCPGGGALSGSMCVFSKYESTMTYYCPSGATLSGSSCTTGQTSTTGANVSYYCPGGGTLKGNKCETSTASTVDAVKTFYCPAGATLNGSSCTTGQTTTTSADPSYYCPSGGTLEGKQCNTSTASTVDAVKSYYCPPGGTLSGTQCLSNSTSTTIADISYSCPPGATLSGQTCTSTSTTISSATPNYSCPGGYPTGYRVSGNMCVGASMDQMVSKEINGCGTLEGLSK